MDAPAAVPYSRFHGRRLARLNYHFRLPRPLGLNAFGIHLFGTLPTDTTNWLLDLAPKAVVKPGLLGWLESADAVEGSAWWNLEQSLIVDELEPNPINRGLATLAGLPLMTEPNAVGQWLEERDQESGDLPESPADPQRVLPQAVRGGVLQMTFAVEARISQPEVWASVQPAAELRSRKTSIARR